jgi:hypothetical protein
MVPVTIPIGFGRDPPQGDIQIDITQMACQNNDPSLRIWADTVNYLITEHNCNSLHEPLTPLDFCNVYIPNAERPKWILNTTPNVFTKVEATEPDSADYKATVKKFDTAGNTLFDEVKHKDPDARAAYSKPSSRTTQTQDNTALVDALGLNQRIATSANKKSATATIQLLCIK